MKRHARCLSAAAAHPPAADHEFMMRSATPLWSLWQQRGSHHGDAKARHQSRHPPSALVRRRTRSHDGDLINAASPSLGTARTHRPCREAIAPVALHRQRADVRTLSSASLASLVRRRTWSHDGDVITPFHTPSETASFCVRPRRHCAGRAGFSLTSPVTGAENKRPRNPFGARALRLPTTSGPIQHS